jgi:hypothetical protein
MRCPSCGKAMIGTRAHGRSRVYRYYTCFTRARYDSGRCHASRLDADAAEHAVVTALASFYRDQHDLIADAIAAAQASHAAIHEGKSAELAATEHELARTGAAIIRSGTDNQRKALVESLVAQIKIIGPDGIVPIFRIPRPSGTDHDGGLQPPDEHNPHGPDAVCAMTKLVELRGLEPLTPCLQSRCSSS